MKSMAQMKCHYGLKVRIYPSDMCAPFLGA